MSELEVIRTDPLDLPADIVWQISGLHHITPKDFKLYISKGKMYVNKSVPEKDIEKMVEIATFPGRYILDDDTEQGEFMNYVYEAYGMAAVNTICNYHEWRIKQQDEQRAKEQLQEVLPLIEKIEKSDHPAIHYNEYLIYEVSKMGGKSKRKTAKNIVSYEDIYIFYLGYLAGSGVVNTDDYHLNSGENILDYYYKISEMLEHIDIQEMPRIYGYLKEMYFSEENET